MLVKLLIVQSVLWASAYSSTSVPEDKSYNGCLIRMNSKERTVVFQDTVIFEVDGLISCYFCSNCLLLSGGAETNYLKASCSYSSCSLTVYTNGASSLKISGSFLLLLMSICYCIFNF